MYCEQKPVIRGAIVDEVIARLFDGGTSIYYALIAYNAFRELALKDRSNYKIILEINLKSIKSRFLELFKFKIDIKNLKL